MPARPRPSRRPRSDAPATPAPLITLPPLGSAPPRPSPRSRPIASRRGCASPPSTSTSRSSRRARPRTTRCAMSRCGSTHPSSASPGRAARPTSTPMPATGMFLPLLERSKVKNGKSMLGMIVEVWTSDDQKFLYEISQVRRHQKTLDDAFAAKAERALAPDIRGSEGHGRQAPGQGQAAVAGDRRPRVRAPEAAPGRLRLSRRATCGCREAGRTLDPVDPTQDDRGDHRADDDGAVTSQNP